MKAYECRSCDTIVRRGRFCSHCGARQPPRIARGLTAALIAGLAVAACVLAFRSLEGGAPELRLRPSSGTWAGEEEFGPEDIVDRAPSAFAVHAQPKQAL